MRLMPARTAMCAAALIECDLPMPRPPRSSQHQSRLRGGSCAVRALNTHSSAMSLPRWPASVLRSASDSAATAARMSCKRCTSLKNRSFTFGRFLAHNHAFDFLAGEQVEGAADFFGGGFAAGFERATDDVVAARRGFEPEQPGAAFHDLERNGGMVDASFDGFLVMCALQLVEAVKLKLNRAGAHLRRDGAAHPGQRRIDLVEADA